MLAPRAPSAFVCLRCELKLARPRPSTLPRRPSHAFSTSARRLHNAHDDFWALWEPEKPKEETPDRLWISREVRVSKRKVINQRKTKLGIKRLEEDAEILVIDEKPGFEMLEKEPDEHEPIVVPDILSTLQQEGAPVTKEEVAKQLDSLRPAHGNPDEARHVTTTDFVKLMAALTRGFTTNQLSHYYSAAKNIKRANVHKAVKAAVQATKRSEWHPTITNLRHRLPGLETVMVHKPKGSRIGKATIVDKILRDVWKLEILEEIEAPGELELRLADWQLKLLQVGGKESTLARIAKLRNAKVEIHWPTNVLRITADKNSAEYTADDVEAALSIAQTRTLDLKPWAARLDTARIDRSNLAGSLTQKDLDFVMSLTRTHIIPFNKQAFRIHGLDETSVADAERTLIKLLPFTESATRTVDTQRLDAAKGKSYLLPTYHDPKSLDYLYRDLSLGRWALPVTRSGDTAAEEQQLGEGTLAKPEPEQAVHSLTNRIVPLMRPPVEGKFTNFEPGPRKRQTGDWQLEPQYTVSADFGQALFPLENSDPNLVTEAAKDPSRSPFQPAIPGLGSLLALSEFENLSRTETPALEYSFIPAPKQEGLDTPIGQDFPQLHIQVRTSSDGKKPTLHKLSLGFRKRVHDVLLPDQAADIRFSRYGRLRFSTKSHHDKNVEEWLEAVRQNIESGGRLSAPPLTIDIPKWTIPGHPSDATGMLPVTYLFSSIQFRQSVTGHMLGTQVSYRTMQSGKLGAKRGMFSAYCSKLKEGQEEVQIRDFATQCLQMVDYITQAGAQTQPIRQSVLPRNEYSARKQRREAVQQQEHDLPSRLHNSSHPDNTSDYGDVVRFVDTDRHLTNSISTDDSSSYFIARLDGKAPNASDLDLQSAADEAAHMVMEEGRENLYARQQNMEGEGLLEDLFGDEVHEVEEEWERKVNEGKGDGDGALEGKEGEGGV